jgi:hypothetical protein
MNECMNASQWIHRWDNGGDDDVASLGRTGEGVFSLKYEQLQISVKFSGKKND